jgi:hypothetical protein
MLLLLGWLGIEFLAYFALTPFPAGRRVMGLAVASLFLLAHLARERIVPKPFLLCSLVAGFALFTLDTWDAWPEKALAEQVQKHLSEAPKAPVWFQGHWGWQYYGERLGWRLVHPGSTRLEQGDYLVIPKIPDEYGFYRPYHGEARFLIPAEKVEQLADLSWDDRIPGCTIPTLYGGIVPVRQRVGPRMRVQLFRVVQPWQTELLQPPR